MARKKTNPTNNTIEIDFLSGDAIEEHTPKSVKRGRGRPPKNKEVETPIQQVTKQNTEQPIEKPRRGRPRGTSTSIKQPVVTQTKEETVVAQTTEQPVEKPRRGRPRGTNKQQNTVTQNTEIEDTVEPVVTQTVEKPRRGRPRGTVTAKQQNDTKEENNVSVAVAVETPPKKRPGRPKGSKNKNLDNTTPSEDDVMDFSFLPDISDESDDEVDATPPKNKKPPKNKEIENNPVTFESDMLLRLRMVLEGDTVDSVQFEELLAPIEAYTEKNIRLGEERHGLKKFIELETLDNLVAYPTRFLSWYVVRNDEDILKAKENLRNEALTYLRDEEKQVVSDFKTRKNILSNLIIS